MKSMVMILFLLGVGVGQTQTPKRVFLSQVVTVVDGTQNDYTAVLMNEFRKRCPTIVTLTESPDNADFIMRYRLKGTTLATQKGDIVFTSNASRYTSAVKDVCKYLETRPN
jgi:hypothetical protein